ISGLALVLVSVLPAAAFTPPYTVTITWGTSPAGTTAAVTVVDSLGATVLSIPATSAFVFPSYLTRAEILQQLAPILREQVKPLVRNPNPPTGTDTFTIGANP